MKQRGRKSAAELSVVAVNFTKAQPDPPDDLNQRQGAIWRLVIKTEADGVFASEALQGLLADYCRHRESAEMLSGVIGSFKAEWLKAEEGAKRYKSLIQMRELETRAAAALATKLRLTNQARYTPQAAATAARNAATGTKPWES